MEQFLMNPSIAAATPTATVAEQRKKVTLMRGTILKTESLPQIIPTAAAQYGITVKLNKRSVSLWFTSPQAGAAWLAKMEAETCSK